MGVSQRGLALAGGGGGAGKSDFLPVKVFKFVDKASAKLFLACATGEHIKKAVLTARYVPDVSATGSPAGDFFVVTLQDVIVSSLNSETGELDGDKTLLETVSLSYAKIEWSYKQVGDGGVLGAAVTGGFDIKANKKLSSGQ